MPKEWPMARKGTAYFVSASHAKTKGIPVLIAMRDILHIADRRMEVKQMILRKEIKVNGKIIHTDKYPIRLFDVLSLEKISKEYRLIVGGKKWNFEDAGKDANKKIVKIIDKKIVKNKIVQMNLQDGTNFVYSKPFSVGDSVVLSLKDNKIEKLLSLKEGAKVAIVSGKHAGKEGSIKEMAVIGKEKLYTIKFKDGEASLPLKTLQVID